ncbi:MAG: hypothetical protein ABSB53_05450 [Nitrososphaerales archaeon]
MSEEDPEEAVWNAPTSPSIPPIEKSSWKRLYRGLFPKRIKVPIDYKKYQEQAVLVMGFLGAMLFAGLVLIIQSDNYAKQVALNVPALVPYLGEWWASNLVSIMETLLTSLVGLCVLGAYASMRTLSHSFVDPRGEKWMYEFIDGVITVVLLGTAVVVGLIVLPFNPVGGTVALGVFVLLYGIFAVLFVRARKGKF